ncbi:MAG TPA: hypothetical protein VGN16_03965 [Acidobacteriaceae bacterium]|jgi:hypothetical protein
MTYQEIQETLEEALAPLKEPTSMDGFKALAMFTNAYARAIDSMLEKAVERERATVNTEAK